MRSSTAPVTILLVEDNEDHALLIEKALRGNGVVNDLRSVATGEQALDYLLRRGSFAAPQASPRPGLILLDLKLPGIDGIEVLKAIKDDPDLKLIPVVMLTTSAAESDVAASYNGGANSYIQKPVDFGRFVETVKQLRMYWLLVNTPSPPPG
jgi:CheY-like chemotaxis protein